MSLRQNALLLILLTGLVAILGEWSTELARWWCVPAAALLLGLAYEVAVLRGARFQLEVRTAEHWLLGRSQQIEFAFRQSSPRTLSIQTALTAPGGFAVQPRVTTLQLPPGTAATASLSAAGRHLGPYDWPAPAMRIGGPLRLAWWTRRIESRCTVTVVPDVAGDRADAAGHWRVGEQRRHIAGAGAEVLQLRDYRPGDPLRIVDWKASARRGRPISRDMSEDQHREVMVAIDAGRASGLGAGEVDRLGLYVNTAARLAQRAADLGDAVGVLAFAAQPLAMLVPARGEAAVARIRSLLGSCRVQPSDSNPVLAAARIRANAQRRCLVVILTDLEDASAGEQLVEAVRLLTPKHFPFIAAFQSARIATLGHATVGEPLGAYRALAALEYGNTIAGNVRALRALGAAAVTALPEHLDRAVFEAYREFRQRRRI